MTIEERREYNKAAYRRRREALGSMHRCYKCGKKTPETENGQTRCNECKLKDKDRAYAYYLAHKEENKEWCKNRYAKAKAEGVV